MRPKRWRANLTNSERQLKIGFVNYVPTLIRSTFEVLLPKNVIDQNLVLFSTIFITILTRAFFRLAFNLLHFDVQTIKVIEVSAVVEGHCFVINTKALVEVL